MSTKTDAGNPLSALCAMVDAWTRYEGDSEQVQQGILANRLGAFPQITGQVLRACGQRVGSEWLHPEGFVVGAPVTVGAPPLFPVCLPLLRKVDGFLELSLRVATLFVADGDASHAGWRFDLADPRPAKMPDQHDRHRGHYVPHVQRITSWTKEPNLGLWYEDFRAATTDAGVDGERPTSPVNGARPAFPLPCKTAPGLLVCLLASLYGSTATEEILELANPLPGWLRSEAEAITGRKS